MHTVRSDGTERWTDVVGGHICPPYEGVRHWPFRRAGIHPRRPRRSTAPSDRTHSIEHRDIGGGGKPPPYEGAKITAVPGPLWEGAVTK